VVEGEEGWGQEEHEGEEGWVMLLRQALARERAVLIVRTGRKGGRAWWRTRGRKGGRKRCWARGCMSVRVILSLS